MRKTLGRSVLSSYGRSSCVADVIEFSYRRLKERLFGIDYSIFDKAIRFFSECKGVRITQREALQRALNKAAHKAAWFSRERTTVADKLHFYLEVEIYPFRQPYLKRYGGFRWYRRLVRHFRHPAILEYGCGSAVLTEYLAERFPEATFSVADVPSVTLEFVTWKKRTYALPYTILTIGPGKDGIPLRRSYDLIICQDVLEHTPNPQEIAEAFVEHLSVGGVLVVDFVNDPGGENLKEAAEQREGVKALLAERLTVLKAIDNGGCDGLYMKEGSLGL